MVQDEAPSAKKNRGFGGGVEGCAPRKPGNGTSTKLDKSEVLRYGKPVYVQ